MCGIAGIYSKDQFVNESQIKIMCNRLISRGPDAEGYYIDGRLGLGHRRLSIIDLDTGDQPMFDAGKTVVIAFNGEIYNFMDLRTELKDLGASFYSKSDTEVVLEAYKAWGIVKTLNKLEGMFAFALYDIIQKQLYISRDKFGEKPLYYSINSHEIRFASELKAFSPNLRSFSIDESALNYFFTLTYIPAPYTIYKAIRKLEAGHYMTVNNEFEFRDIKYFDLKTSLANLNTMTSFENAKSTIRKQIMSSVKQRMVSDVPIGVFLSGGIDSSIIATVLSKLSDQPINTFSIGFKERAYDEGQRAQLVANAIKSNHKIQYLDYKDAASLVNEIIMHYDEPFGDSSAIPSYYVAKLAQEKVKVVLTGDCADELFGGYEKYLGRYYAEHYLKLPKPLRTLLKILIFNIPHNRLTNVLLRKAKKVIANSTVSDFDLHYNMMSLGFNDAERANLLNSKWYFDVKHEIESIYNSCPLNTSLEKSQYTDIMLVLEGDMFVKTDRVCMKNSLESRAPFIDSAILNSVFSIPPDFKIKGNKKKYILREAYKNYLPARTLKFRKKGFGVPIDYWFKNELKGELDKLLDAELIESQGIFNLAHVRRLFEEHQSGRENHKSKLWSLYVFQNWYLTHYN